jgi:hypothetical protein
MNHANPSFSHLLAKSKEAKTGGQAAWSYQSTGERIAVALVLNRADWLASIDYTLGEAIDRLGPEWLAAVPLVERALNED